MPTGKKLEVWLGIHKSRLPHREKSPHSPNVVQCQWYVFSKQWLKNQLTVHFMLNAFLTCAFMTFATKMANMPTLNPCHNMVLLW